MRARGDEATARAQLDAVMEQVADGPRYGWPVLVLASRIETELVDEGRSDPEAHARVMHPTSIAERLSTATPATRACAATFTAEQLCFAGDGGAVNAWDAAVEAWRVAGEPPLSPIACGSSTHPTPTTSAPRRVGR